MPIEAARTNFAVNVSGGNMSKRGFTLIELIMVLLMLGFLAAYAAPKMFSSGDFYARGFHDETLALLRYAQKTAISQRHMVCVTFNTAATPNTASLTMESPTLTTTPINCNINVVGPKGESPATVTASTRSRVSYSSAPNLIFDGLGQPVDTSRQPLVSDTTVRVADGGTPISKTITIVTGTGYVHD